MFDTMITCPVCGYAYVHFNNAINKEGKDNYEAWEGRADCIEIPMNCEEGHGWIMVIGHHKGNTYTFNKVIKKEEKIMEINLVKD